MELIAQKSQPIQQGIETQQAEAVSDFSLTLSDLQAYYFLNGNFFLKSKQVDLLVLILKNIEKPTSPPHPKHRKGNT